MDGIFTQEHYVHVKILLEIAYSFWNFMCRMLMETIDLELIGNTERARA